MSKKNVKLLKKIKALLHLKRDKELHIYEFSFGHTLKATEELLLNNPIDVAVFVLEQMKVDISKSVDEKIKQVEALNAKKTNTHRTNSETR